MHLLTHPAGANSLDQRIVWKAGTVAGGVEESVDGGFAVWVLSRGSAGDGV